jgi:short-subunit dehydrogenase
VDVGDIEAMERKLLEIDDRLPVDLIIANAGVNSNTLRQSASADYGAFGVNGDRLDFVDMIRPIVQTDFVGTIGSFEPLLRRFMQRRRGQIALVSSMAGLMPVLSTPTYSSVKSALVRLTEGLRPVLGRYNVRLNVVCPGYVRTNMNASFKQTPLFRSLVDCRQAAQWIQQGLERDCGLIVFPITQYLLVTAVYAVPQPIREWLFLNLWRRGWLPKEGEVVTCPL